MGFTFNGQHSDVLDICVRTERVPYIAEKRSSTIVIPGRDGEYITEYGYENQELRFDCNIYGTREDRRDRARQIGEWLSSTGTLVLDDEPDKQYQVVKTVNNIHSSYRDPQLPVEDFTLSFTCKPHAESVALLEVSQSVSHGDEMVISNLGTYKSFPVIKMEGVASEVSVGEFTISDLDSTIFIDCDRQIVYEIVGGEKVNKISMFSGIFPALNPGDNTFPISGSITSLTVTFNYRYKYR